MEQAHPPGGVNPSWGEVPQKKQQQQQQQKPLAMSQHTDQYDTLSPNSGAWQPGICDCCSDVDSCCCACCWCPCPKFRRNDYCTECCCLPCCTAQQTRELKSSGVDPKLGWEWEPNKEAYFHSLPPVPKMQK